MLTRPEVLNGPVDLKDGSVPEVTLTGSPIIPVAMGLPKTTLSLCPECLSIIPAKEYENGGKVPMTKECKDHGIFNDIISSDVKIFSEMERWHFRDGSGFSNPQVRDAYKCPTECGICNMHMTHTAVANIDITAKCNIKCNICFADSNRNLYEPSYDEIYLMLKRLRETKPVLLFSIQEASRPSTQDSLTSLRPPRTLGSHIFRSPRTALSFLILSLR